MSTRVTNPTCPQQNIAVEQLRAQLPAGKAFAHLPVGPQVGSQSVGRTLNDDTTAAAQHLCQRAALPSPGTSGLVQKH